MNSANEPHPIVANKPQVGASLSTPPSWARPPRREHGTYSSLLLVGARVAEDPEVPR